MNVRERQLAVKQEWELELSTQELSSYLIDSVSLLLRLPDIMYFMSFRF